MIKYSAVDICRPKQSKELNPDIVRGVIVESDPLELQARLTSLKYRGFLRTPYWRFVANEVKTRDGHRCRVCGESGNIHAHHRDYAVWGKEHLNLGELVTMCKGCHQLAHKKCRWLGWKHRNKPRKEASHE